MRQLACILVALSTFTVSAQDEWRSVLAGMPLRTNVTELNTFNYVNTILGAFKSNDTVKALVFMPGAVDTFFWRRETAAQLTNTSPTLLDAVVALTNQTRIRATFRPPWLLLHFDWDPLEHATNCSSKAGPGTGRFETDSRYVHQKHWVHPKHDGDLRAEPDRVQRMGRPARLLEQGTRCEDA